jgi:hypothetical protein
MSNEAIGAAFSKAITTIRGMLRVGEQVVFLEDDQSRFDLHLNRGPFEFLNKFYKSKIGRHKAALLRRGVSSGRSSMGSKYKIPYTMQSGWPDTSAGDTAVNAAMKFDVHGIGGRWISIICGDDSVTVTVDSEIDALGGMSGICSKYATYGMEVTGKITTDPLEVEFCSGVFVHAGVTPGGHCNYLLFPKVGKILGRIGWDMKDRRPSKRLEWLRAIACTLDTYGVYDPVMRSMCLAIREHAGVGRVADLHKTGYEKFFDNSLPPSSVNIYEHYHHHYDMSADDVDRLADYVLRAPLGLYDHPHLCEMARRDV